MKRIFNIVIILLFFASNAMATHQRAAEVTYKHLYGLTYEFTITMYTKTSSPADNDRFVMPISWGDGTGDEIPRIYFQPIPNVFDITLNIYKGTHTFPGPSSYLISVEDPNRNFGVINIPNSVNVPIFVETLLVINPFMGYNNSAVLLNPPIDQGCIGKTFIHNPAAYDPDGDSLSYKLVECRGAGGYAIPGYTFPMASDFFTIDPVLGDVIWETPILQGEYNIAFEIEEWRFGTKISSVMRDMQVNIVACDHDPPDIYSIDDTCIVAGSFLQFDVTAIDVDQTNVELTAVGGPFEQNQNPAYIYPDPASGNDTVTTTFSWPTLCNHVRLEPYNAVFKARDNGFPVNLVNFKTVTIKVIAPAPENLQSEPLGIGIDLTWGKSTCNNAIGYKIYRRSGPSGWEPDYCETGVPAYTGFKLIGQVDDVNTTAFRDDNNGEGLVHGIDYCYRITAIFFDEAESYASNETCSYLKRDVPIITNVTNDSTNLESGVPTIIWSKPTELDTIQYPGPYKYLLYRDDGISWTNPQLIKEFYSLNDTIYIDNEINLNTKTEAVSYKVKLESISVGDIGYSQLASSVYIVTQPSDQKIKLLWEPKVPWINEYSIVFRKNPNTSNYDSIGTTNTNFYIDKGLTNFDEYCYYIKTVGGYSLSGLIYPIINFSQIACDSPRDNVPPCTPTLSVSTNCEDINNELAMSLPYDSCSYDASKYYIYYKPSGDDSFHIIDSVNYELNDTSYFLHANLESVVGCYFITAIDSVGNISDSSNIECVGYDVCPNYDLPNVFTPNGDDKNPLFVPMGMKKDNPYNPKSNVNKVNMTIFNRWGNTVFTTEDTEIRWDGKNKKNNKDCESGVYYYVCDVYLNTLEGEVKITLQGPITIIR